MVAIIDYEAGNLTSVARALTQLGYENEITYAAEKILAADRIIFPGVGAAKATMQTLRNRGLDRVLEEAYQTGKPMLGICIGIQILFEHSDEEDTQCLGFLPGKVRKFPYALTQEQTSRQAGTSPLKNTDADTGKNVVLKVPQIGWNEMHQTQSHPIFKDIPNPAHFYFVNSYYPVPNTPDVMIGKTTYGLEFCSVLEHDNLIATQFHLEKSGKIGLKMLNNFLTL